MFTLQRILDTEIPIDKNISIDDYIMSSDQARLLLESVSDRFGRVLENSRAGEHTIEKYRYIIEHGEFKVSTIQFAYVKSEPHVLYLTNGRHRLHATSKANGDCAVPFIIQVRAVDSIGEVKELIDTHDTGKTRSRTDLDLISELHLELGLDKYDMGRLVSVVDTILTAMYPRSIGTRKISYQTMLAAKKEWAPYLQQYDEIMRGHGGTEISRFLRAVRNRCTNAGVTTIGMLTLRSCPKLARPFWMMLANNQNLESTTTAVVAMSQFIRDTDTTSRIPYMHALARYWDAFVMDRPISSNISVHHTAKVLSQNPKPFKLACTPYKGNAHIFCCPSSTDKSEISWHKGAENEMITTEMMDTFAEFVGDDHRVKRRLASLADEPMLA